MQKFSVIVLAVSLVLTGCHSKTPWEKLQSETVYPELNDAFWNQEMHAHTALWKAAKAYCQKATSPNCMPVVRQIFFDGSTKVPAYGSSKHKVTVPDF